MKFFANIYENLTITKLKYYKLRQMLFTYPKNSEHYEWKQFNKIPGRMRVKIKHDQMVVAKWIKRS